VNTGIAIILLIVKELLLSLMDNRKLRYFRRNYWLHFHEAWRH